MSSPSARDEAWHAAIYEKYRTRVLKMLMFTRRVDYHSAEDIYQDTSLTVWVKRLSLPDEPELGAWIFTAAKNHLLNYVKRNANARHEQLDDTMSNRNQAASAEAWIEDMVENKELADLSLADQRILILVEGYEFSCREAAKILDIKPAAARQRLKRARANARKLVLQLPDENGGDIGVLAK